MFNTGQNGKNRRNENEYSWEMVKRKPKRKKNPHSGQQKLRMLNDSLIQTIPVMALRYLNSESQSHQTIATQSSQRNWIQKAQQLISNERKHWHKD